MTIQLTKGGNANLTKDHPGLTKLRVGLGWDANANGKPFDLDVHAFMLNAAGKVRTEKSAVYFNNLKSEDGSVTHSGDDRTGSAPGDDETISIDLSKVPADVTSIAIGLDIFEGDKNGTTFGQVKNAGARVYNDADNTKLAEFDLTEDAGAITTMVFAEIYRKDAEWKVRALGTPVTGGLAALYHQYGL